MSDILFIKTSSLGDVIHHMPALTEARRQRPQARFSWVVEEAYAPLVALHPAVDTVISVASRRWRSALLHASTWHELREFAHSLRLRSYDEIIDTQGLVRSALMARWARGRRHGYDMQSVRERPAALFYDVRHHVDGSLHAIERNRRLTAMSLDYAIAGEIDFGLERRAIAAGAGKRYAVLLHGTARRDKEWSVASWIALGQALREREVSLVLPWGTETERARSERIAASLVEAQVPARRPLDLVARLIAGASFVIGVDTGLVHLAAAFGVPLVAIFVGSEPGLTGPMGSGPIAVVGDRGAVPTVAAVTDALSRILPV